MLPNFLICGAPRSGTTFLMRNLSAHPDIYMAVADKGEAGGDLHFFDVGREEGRVNFDRGVGWYSSHFDQVEAESAVGEKTADYLSDLRAPSLIKECLGHVKLVVAVRDPVARACSHFWHSRHRFPEVKSLDQLIARRDCHDNPIIKDGFYWEGLCRFFDYFEERDVLVVVNEDFYSEPEVHLRRVCDFLGVDQDVSFPDASKKINGGASGRVSYFLARFGMYLKKRRPNFYRYLMEGRFSSVFVAIIKKLRGKREGDVSEGSVSTYPGLSDETVARLRAVYSDDVKQLSDWVGRDLAKEWWGKGAAPSR